MTKSGINKLRKDSLKKQMTTEEFLRVGDAGMVNAAEYKKELVAKEREKAKKKKKQKNLD